MSKVTVDVSQGDTWTLGTNYEKTTVGDTLEDTIPLGYEYIGEVNINENSTDTVPNRLNKLMIALVTAAQALDDDELLIIYNGTLDGYTMQLSRGLLSINNKISSVAALTFSRVVVPTALDQCIQHYANASASNISNCWYRKSITTTSGTITITEATGSSTAYFYLSALKFKKSHAIAGNDLSKTVATIESTSTASKTYSVGEWFIDSQGYTGIVKTAIASGETFTLGTNYERKTVGSRLSEHGTVIKEYVTFSNTTTTDDLQTRINYVALKALAYIQTLADNEYAEISGFTAHTVQYLSQRKVRYKNTNTGIACRGAYYYISSSTSKTFIYYAYLHTTKANVFVGSTTISPDGSIATVDWTNTTDDNIVSCELTIYKTY